MSKTGKRKKHVISYELVHVVLMSRIVIYLE